MGVPVLHVLSDRNGRPADQALLAQFTECGAATAFAALLARHGPMVLDVCRSVLGNDTDAEDAFQATFLVLARNAGSIRNPGAVASWLHGVALRTARKARAQFARRRRREAQAATPEGRTDDDLSWREAQCVLHEELAGLAERYRLPLVLCYLQGKTQDEVARLLGLAPGTLKSRLEKGRSRLRARLIRRGLGPAALLLAMAWPAGHAMAALPAPLLAATTQAAVLIASGQTTAGVVTAEVAGLAGPEVLWTFHAQLAALLLALVVSAAGLALAQEAPVEPPMQFHHDFRQGLPLPDWLKLDGPAKDAAIDLKDGGLRIALPRQRDTYQAVGVATKLLYAGDFEITAAFELLSASHPSGGYGVGVSLNLAQAANRIVFAKVARFIRAKEGSVFVSEFWNNHPPKTYGLKFVPTQARFGRLQLVRSGERLRFLAADGLDGDFEQIDEFTIGSADLTQLRLVVSDSGQPGNTVDARLLELKIAGSKVALMTAPPPLPPAPPPVQVGAVEPGIEPGTAPAPRRRLWLVLALVVLAASLAAALASRRRLFSGSSLTSRLAAWAKSLRPTKSFAALTGRQKAVEVLRWLGVLPAAWLGDRIGTFLYIGVAGLAFGDLHYEGFDRWVRHLTARLLGGTLYVILGATMAPRFGHVVAIALALLSIALAGLIHGWDDIPVFADAIGVACGVALVCYWQRTWHEHGALEVMTRRRVVSSVVVVIGVGLVVYGFLPVYREYRYAVNEAGVGQVAVGMSRAEVEGLLGRGGDHQRKVQRKLTAGETVIVAGKAFVGPAELKVSFVDWWCPRQDDYVRVGFDDNDRAFATERIPAPGMLLRLRGWLLGF